VHVLAVGEEEDGCGHSNVAAQVQQCGVRATLGR